MDIFDFSSANGNPASREAVYNARVVARHKELRSQRLQHLRSRKKAMSDALEAYATLDREGDVTDVRLRSDFVRRAERRPHARDEDRLDVPADRHRVDLNSRPPAAQLIYRAGHALPFYMTVLYVLRTEASPGQVPTNVHANASGYKSRPSWARLAGLQVDDTRTRRGRVTRAVRALRQWQLVALEGEGTWEGFRVLREDGSERPYTVPGVGKHMITLPASFFLSGWHLVLEPTELLVFLAIVELAQNVEADPEVTGYALPTSERWARYGLSDETYASAHELDEFGLVKLVDTMPNRRRGRVRTREETQGNQDTLAPEPYRFEYGADQLKRLERPAYQVVVDCLTRAPGPPRLAS